MTNSGEMNVSGQQSGKLSVSGTQSGKLAVQNFQVNVANPLADLMKRFEEQNQLFAKGIDDSIKPIKDMMAATVTAEMVMPGIKKLTAEDVMPGITQLTAHIYPIERIQESVGPPAKPDDELPPVAPKTRTRYYMDIVDDGPGEMLEVIWTRASDGKVIFHDMDHTDFTPHWASLALAEKFVETFIREVEGI